MQHYFSASSPLASLTIYNPQNKLLQPIQKICTIHELMTKQDTKSTTNIDAQSDYIDDISNEIISCDPSKIPLHWILIRWDSLSDLYLAKCIACSSNDEDIENNAAHQIVQIIISRNLSPYIFLADKLYLLLLVKK